MKCFAFFLSVGLCLAAALADEGNAPSRSNQAEKNAKTNIATSLPPNISSLFEQRLRSTVAVEFLVQEEIDRQRVITRGTVIDEQGVIALSNRAIRLSTPPDRLRDFKVYLLGEESDGYPASYMGVNFASGIHYIRVEPDVAKKLTPITRYPQAVPSMGEMLWGISSKDEAFSYKPSLEFGNMVFTHAFPLRYGFAKTEISGVGAPVFNANGDLVGVGVDPAIRNYFMYFQGRSAMIGLIPDGGTDAFVFAADFLKYASRLPKSPAGDPEAWLGIEGLRPVDKDVASFFKLEGQGAVVVSEIIAESPAQKAGLKNKDVLISIDKKPLPKFKPEESLLQWIAYYIADKNPGDLLSLGVARGTQRLDLQLELGQRPMRDRNAPRLYLPRMGLSVRMATIDDAIKHRLFRSDLKGAVVSFLRQNAPAATAEMQIGDWIKEIDGIPVDSYEKAVEILKKIDADAQRKEAVIMINRATETKVFRLKLN